ncbi:hypothetical protein M3J09_012161 [Ascochyta lentis]
MLALLCFLTRGVTRRTAATTADTSAPHQRPQCVASKAPA